MKLYIANGTCSRAAQVIANEIGIAPELIHFDTQGKSTSTNEDFAEINSLGYVPVLTLDNSSKDRITETTVVISYLADQHPEAGLIAAPGTLDRVKMDQLLVFSSTEIAQKHIPLMRKLQTEDGAAWTRNKLVVAYQFLDDKLADGRQYLAGDTFSVLDAYVWATMWGHRSGIDIEHLANVAAWKARVETRPSVQKALTDEAEIVAIHKAQIAARAA